MLGFSAWILFTNLFVNVLHREVSWKLGPLLYFTILGIILFSILFWGSHATICTEPEETDRYEKNWNEVSEINGYSFLYEVVILTIMIIMIKNHLNIEYEKNAFCINWPIAIILLILDIITTIVIYNTYSYDIKESIIDSVLFQFSRLRKCMVLLFIVGIFKTYTITGVFLTGLCICLCILVIKFLIKILL